ncbi:MAG: hypothetical protein ABJD57_26605, partial [Roseibium sp.]
FLMDLPVLFEEDSDAPVRLAAFASPWPGALMLMRSATGSGFQPVLTLDRPATLGHLVSDLAPGPLGQWDHANHIDVEIYGGLLQARSQDAVLAGANALAVRTTGGGFEVLQFVDADLTGVRTYRLTTLLRGQSGSEPEMREGALAGAEVVLLDAATVPVVPLSSDQLGLEQHYRLVPAGLAVDDPSALAFVHAASGRGALPLAPVHLKARRQGDDIEISFIRQTRRGGDSWAQVEVPLGEENEAYEVDILGVDGGVLRTLVTSVTSVFYPLTDEISDFGAQVAELSFAVCQLSATAGRGVQRKATSHV